MNTPEKPTKQCFVCKKALTQEHPIVNKKTNLPVCKTCNGSQAEKDAEEDLLDSLAEDFVCGCI